jgi:acetyl esterase/lipase
VLPNYRLAPEHTGNDILEDLTDFWAWFNSGGVDKYLTSQSITAELDYDHVLASGESAGGYMAIQSGLTRPKGEIKAILAQYPMTNYLRSTPDKDTPPSSIIDEHLAAVRPASVLSSTPLMPARFQLAAALSAHGRYNDYLGTGKHLWPITAIEDAKYLPPTYIIHGEQDSIVAAVDSKDFVKKAQAILPDAELRLDIRSGDCGHGFDVGSKEDEEEWLQKSLKWVEEKWLA